MTCSGDFEGDIKRRMLELQEKHLIPLKDDLADWLNKTLAVDFITPENFLHVLDNGVIVCKLVKIIQRKIEERSRRGSIQEIVPPFNFKCWENAKSESFYARDNVDNFLKWCRKYGVREAVLFESDGLVLHSQQRTVVLCLLELGRVASRQGMEPPGLIKLENEIDAEHGSGQIENSSRASSPGAHGDFAAGIPLSASKTRLSELDKKVIQVTKSCGCTILPIRRVSEGRYCIAGRTVFVRLLKERHVMVRVGGGWETLEQFLIRHDPCQVIMVDGKPTATLHENQRVHDEERLSKKWCK
uniref:GAR domain-containing protein n=1 Tax=Strigamia maritima TaxID=126957 RepID=T1JCK6_STRMM